MVLGAGHSTFFSRATLSKKAFASEYQNNSITVESLYSNTQGTGLLYYNTEIMTISKVYNRERDVLWDVAGTGHLYYNTEDYDYIESLKYRL